MMARASSFAGKIEEWTLWTAGMRSLSIQLDITNACNLSCLHCYHSDHKNSGNLSIEEWLLVLNQYDNLLKRIGAEPNIAICGGEPLVSPILFPLLSEITSRWPRSSVGIMTNGTRISQAIDDLSKFPLYFQISMESANESGHDKIRGVGSFGRMIKGVLDLRKRHFDVHGLVVLSGRTSRQIVPMFELASQLGLSSLNFTRAIPSGFGRIHFGSNNDSILTGTELMSAMSEVIRASKISGISTNTDKPLYCLIDSKLGGTRTEGFQGLVVDYQGFVKVSSRSELRIGHVFKDGLGETFFRNELLRNVRRGIISKCRECRFLNQCGGDRNFAFATTGDYLGIDSGCWLEE